MRRNNRKANYAMYEADRETKHKAQTIEGRATELLQTTDAADLVRLIDAAKEIVRIEDTGDEDTVVGLA